jgi:hypothetical protein
MLDLERQSGILPNDSFGNAGMPLSIAARVILLVSMFITTGCAVHDADLALRGKSELVGLQKNDLLMCAGHPANEDTIPGGKIWMYEHANVDQSVITVAPTLPLVGTAVTPPSAGYCRVQFRIMRDKVTEVSYAGATDEWGRRDAGCAPIIRNCIEYRTEKR